MASYRFGSGQDEVKFSQIESAKFDEAIKLAFILAKMRNEITDDIGKLRNLLRHELKVNSNYRDAWMLAEKLFEDNKEMEKYTALRREGIPTEYHIALICYVLNAIYQKFNEDTRNVKTFSNFKNYKWKSLFKFLSLACDELVGYPQECPKIIYRGFSGTHSDAKKGKRVVFQNFISATQDVEIAMGYALKCDKPPIVKPPTVFVFQGPISRSIGLEHHLSEHNKEILLSPYNSYIIQDIFTKEKVRYIYLKVEDNSDELFPLTLLFDDSHSENNL